MRILDQILFNNYVTGYGFIDSLSYWYQQFVEIILEPAVEAEIKVFLLHTVFIFDNYHLIYLAVAHLTTNNDYYEQIFFYIRKITFASN